MSKIAAGWIRVSSQGQADPSLGDQLSSIKSKATELGYELPPERVLSVVWASQELSNCPSFQKLQEGVYAQEIEAMFTMFYENGLHVQITDSEAYAEGDVGYKIGTFIMTTADGSVLDEGKYTEIWRRLNGQWMLHRDMFNSNLPVPPAEPQAAPDGEPEGED